MSKLLEAGIKAVQSLPEERQDVAGELLLKLVELDRSPRYRPSPEQVAGINEDSLRRIAASSCRTR